MSRSTLCCSNLCRSTLCRSTLCRSTLCRSTSCRWILLRRDFFNISLKKKSMFNPYINLVQRWLNRVQTCSSPSEVTKLVPVSKWQCVNAVKLTGKLCSIVHLSAVRWRWSGSQTDHNDAFWLADQCHLTVERWTIILLKIPVSLPAMTHFPLSLLQRD